MLKCYKWLALAIGLIPFYFAQAQSQGNTNSTDHTAFTNDVPPYILGPNDLVQLKVYQEDDLDARERILQDGTVTLPLLGPVPLAGKTVEKATSLVRDLLAKDYLVHPQVTLSVVEFAKRRFIVLGQVQRPGAFELPGDKPLNLLQAIAMAGGYTRIGSPRKVTVQRLVDGDQKIFKLDADAMSKDKEAKQFEILPEDTITVGEKLF